MAKVLLGLGILLVLAGIFNLFIPGGSHMAGTYMLMIVIGAIMLLVGSIITKRMPSRMESIDDLVRRYGSTVLRRDSAGATCNHCRNKGKYCDESGRSEESQRVKQALGSQTCPSFDA